MSEYPTFLPFFRSFKDLPRVVDLKKSGYDSLASVVKELREKGSSWDNGFMRSHRVKFPKVIRLTVSLLETVT